MSLTPFKHHFIQFNASSCRLQRKELDITVAVWALYGLYIYITCHPLKVVAYALEGL